MTDNLFLQQLAQRMDGDRQAMIQTRDILYSLIDRELWKQMQTAQKLPTDIEEVENFLASGTSSSATSR